MNLIHLKYVTVIAETGSLGRAAERLRVAQPNLSRAVKEMEGHLGISIFRRTPKGMVPTPDGETFLNYARKILAQVNAVEGFWRCTLPPSSSTSPRLAPPILQKRRRTSSQSWTAPRRKSPSEKSLPSTG